MTNIKYIMTVNIVNSCLLSFLSICWLCVRQTKTRYKFPVYNDIYYYSFYIMCKITTCAFIVSILKIGNHFYYACKHFAAALLISKFIEIGWPLHTAYLWTSGILKKLQNGRWIIHRYLPGLNLFCLILQSFLMQIC